MMTDDPAQLFGLRDRGRLAEGYIADIVVFDPRDVTSEDATLVTRPARRAPRGSPRARSAIKRVLVNGVEIVRDGAATGATPGTLLRSGRDTVSVNTR